MSANVLTILSLSERAHCGIIQRIAGQVKSADSFESHDLAVVQQVDRALDCEFGFDDRAVDIVFAENYSRTAFDTGSWFGMKPAVKVVFVLSPAFVAHLEFAHRGLGAVVGY